MTKLALPKLETISYETFDGLPKEDQDLLLAAEEMLGNSYAPYSRFHVAAALLYKDGDCTTGNNLENASYGLTNCAERAAIAEANNFGRRDILKIGIITGLMPGNSRIPENTDYPSMPCGACRQVIYEAAQLSGEDIEVISANTEMKRVLRRRISELLPLAFGPLDLGIDISKYQGRQT